MVTTATTRAKAQNTAAPEAEKRVILSMGGKGGVGKTSVMSGLAEWFMENEIPVSLLDLDSENKSRGSQSSPTLPTGARASSRGSFRRSSNRL